MDSMLRKVVLKAFRLSGLDIRKDACDFLTDTLTDLEDNERNDWLDKVIEFIQQQPLQLPVVEKKLIEVAILDSCKNEVDEEEDIFSVISALEVPKFVYNHEIKKFILMEKDKFKTNIFASADKKGNFFKERYDIIYQFTARNSLFSQECSEYKLKSIDYLLSVQVVDRVVVLGLLTNLKEGQFYLEDPGGFVLVDLSHAIFYDGLFTDGCFVLAEGSFCDGVLKIEAIGLPPREDPELSRTFFSSPDYFGGTSKLSIKSNERLRSIETRRTETMMIIISDIWLDQPEVLKRLEQMFHGFNDAPPYAFILMGNFLSSAKGFEHFRCLRDGFRNLSEILSQFKNIIKCSRFVIIPGPSDSPSANIFPYPELPDSLISDLKSVASYVYLATNPCRLRYCTQEIVVVREDLVTKMCRNCISYPTSKDVGWHFARSIICQATLAPLSLNVCPIYWDCSASLQLYPCPDLIIVGDKQQPFTSLYNNCNVVNPGSFSAGEYSFKVYYFSNKSIDDCQISEPNID